MTDTTSQTAARIAQEKERDDFRRRLDRETAVAKVFSEFPSKFKLAPDEVLKTLDKVHFVDGKAFAGELPLEQALENYVKINGHAVAGTIAEQHDSGRSTVRAKSDLSTPKDVADFIKAHSLAAYEALPLVPAQELDESTLSIEQYRRLSVTAKAKLIVKYGSNFPATLQKAEQERQRADRLAGIPQGKR